MVKTVAIIGCGPRGLSALEDIFTEFAKNKSAYELKVLIFERTGNFGSGQVYAPNQTLHNWLNINERALTIAERKTIQLNNESVEGFPSFQDWNGYNPDSIDEIDKYPPRAVLGTYLEARFNSIAQKLKQLNVLEMHASLVTSLKFANDTFLIEDNKQKTYNADEVVLTVGHQPTQTSKQIENWKHYEDNNASVTLFHKPYPIEGLFKDNTINGNSRVAIRGFGLAMIDVVRGIAGFTDSRFDIVNSYTQKMTFHAGTNCPKKIIPFSLDGLPMAPKPINASIDNWFLPTDADFDMLKGNLKNYRSQPEEVDSTATIITTMATIIVEVFLSLKTKSISHNYNTETLQTLVEAYIEDDKTASDIIISNTLSAKTIIERFVNMAVGQQKISLDYCIGQVWRLCQPTLYEYLSYTEFHKDVILDIIQLDEKLKRLSFGPPVASLQQLLALLESGIMTVKAVDDPDIECTENGWVLDGSNTDYTANVMINSVLDSPKVLMTDTPLIKQLLKDKYVFPIHKDLGIKTNKNGMVSYTSKEHELPPIAVLGRLAQGTLLGVDAVLECFGKRSRFWSKDVLKRLDKKKIN
tara:strand:+ start:12708 stop:14453 length:1746 start_codon:yes stop_codon:yes gene_type:complete